jgi:ArsR family metal-binding transcriptional regulator
MWIITCYSNSGISMFEFKTEQEAREQLKVIKGYSILSEVVYFNDACFQQESA